MKHFLLIACIFFASFLDVAAQNISAIDSRAFNLSILSIIDEYDRLCSFNEPSDRKFFLRLFEDCDSPCVYNDLVGFSEFQAPLSPRKYVGLIPDDGSVLLRSFVSNIKKQGDIFFQNGKYHRKVSFVKSLVIIDMTVYKGGEGGVLFDSGQAFKDKPDFDLVWEFVYDPLTHKCSISSITAVDYKSHSPFDEQSFSIVLKPLSSQNFTVKSREAELEYNEFDQAIAFRNDISVDDDNVNLSTFEYAKGDKYNVIGLKVNPFYFRTKIYADITLGNAFDLSFSDPNVKGSSSGWKAGLDFGFVIPILRNWRMGLFAGCGFSKSTINLSSKELSYTLDYAPDKSYNFTATENLVLSDIMVPVYIENEFPIWKRLSLAWDVGARVYLNQKTELSPFTVNGKIAGTTVSDMQYQSFKSPANYTRSPFDLSIFTDIEVDIRLIGKAFYLYVLYGYEWGIRPSYSSGWTFFDKSSHIYPIYYSPYAKTNVAYRSLVGSTSYTRKGGWLSIGLKFKF